MLFGVHYKKIETSKQLELLMPVKHFMSNLPTGYLTDYLPLYR
jgi:hypothetical protein